MDVQAAVDTFNAIEVVLWIGLAIYILRNSKPRNGRAWAWFIGLILFGLSDLVELQTGAFWRPWWLFAWKATCVVTFIALLISRPRSMTPVSNPREAEPEPKSG